MERPSSHYFSLAQVRCSQISISRAWRRHFSVIQRSKGRVLIRVSYPSELDCEAPILVGSFTSPVWTPVDMKYSLSCRAYVLEVWMSVNDMFQLYHKRRCVFLPQFLKSQYHQMHSEDCMMPVYSAAHYKAMLSFHAKKTRKVPMFSFQAAASLLPKDGKLLEDAHFLESHMLGVADGVGGWRGLGVDSGKFASELIQACKEQALDSWSLVLTPLTLDSGSEEDSSVPYSFLLPVAEKALKRVESSGSSTLLLCAINSGMLEVLSLGDSRAMLVRFVEGRGVVVMRTHSMQHHFNCPYQVAKPLSMEQKEELLRNCPQENLKELTKVLKSSSRLINDGFESAEIYTVRVRHGDLLLLGSDGLWDNLYESEVLSTLSSASSAEDIARRLTRVAYLKSRSSAKTPFEEEAVMTYGQCAWKGGKQDDITVIAAWVKEEKT